MNVRPFQRMLVALAPALALTITGCDFFGDSTPPEKPDFSKYKIEYEYDPYSDYGNLDYREIKFKDDAKTNAEPNDAINNLQFTNRDGEEVSVKDLAPGKNLVLVITRGVYGEICVFCSTQTSRLMTNYVRFGELNTEVAVVFPMKANDEAAWKSFVRSAHEKTENEVTDETPFPLLLDLGLKVTKELDIESVLAKPATYIFDKDRRLRYAYVGENIADRPSIEALLNELKQINEE